MCIRYPIPIVMQNNLQKCQKQLDPFSVLSIRYSAHILSDIWPPPPFHPPQPLVCALPLSLLFSWVMAVRLLSKSSTFQHLPLLPWRLSRWNITNTNGPTLIPSYHQSQQKAISQDSMPVNPPLRTLPSTKRKGLRHIKQCPFVSLCSNIF